MDPKKSEDPKGSGSQPPPPSQPTQQVIRLPSLYDITPGATSSEPTGPSRPRRKSIKGRPAPPPPPPPTAQPIQPTPPLPPGYEGSGRPMSSGSAVGLPTKRRKSFKGRPAPPPPAPPSSQPIPPTQRLPPGYDGSGRPMSSGSAVRRPTEPPPPPPPPKPTQQVIRLPSLYDIPTGATSSGSADGLRRRAVSAEDLTTLSRQFSALSTTDAQGSRHRHRAGDTGAPARVRRMSAPALPTIPISPLIFRFRDDITGEPDFDAMRDELPRDPDTGELVQLSGPVIARRSRARIMNEHVALGHKKHRMDELLDNLPLNEYERVTTDDGERYIRRSRLAPGHHLQPSTAPFDDRYNQRVNRGVQAMQFPLIPNTSQRRVYDSHRPVGRMGTRPTPVSPEDSAKVELMKRAIGKDFTERDLNYIHRIQRLHSEDRDLYDAYMLYRDQTNLDSDDNVSLRSRMVPRAGSDYSLREWNERRLRRLRSKIDEARGVGDRETRIATGHERRRKAATIPSTHMPRDLRGVDEIAEEEEPPESE